MKIVNFKQEDICYMWKDSLIKIDRSDVWGNPEDNSESILTYCREFSEVEEDENAHVVYFYAQGGVGKSFVCREIAKKLQARPYSDGLYVVVVDLQKQKNFEDNLKCLADEIAGQMGRKEMFPRFHMAYYSYKMKKGEEVRQEERSTKWEDLHDNASFHLVTGVAGFLTSFGTVSDVIDLASEGYKWFLKMRESVQYKSVARQIETMGEKELRDQLVRYFAADFCECMGEKKDKKRKKKKVAFLLDTVESMRYQALRRGDEEDYLEWLTGSDGLFRLLPDCFWLLFGREEIPWKNYDRDWETSFISRELERPGEKVIQEYLLKQLGQGASEELCKTEGELYAIINEIIRQTERYSLAIENCVDVYFRIWNKNLRINKITDLSKVDGCRPSLEEMGEMLTDGRGKKIISARFLQYYTLQEREVLYTLVCLGTWTDEILETLIWKGAVNNILIYEEMCATSFIYTGGDGQKSIQGLMLDVIMEECSQRLKKKLFFSILEEMGNREEDAVYWLLFQSAIHIAEFSACDKKEWELLGIQFVRAAEYLLTHGGFYELSKICDGILKITDDADEDLYNAICIGRYFACVFRKKEEKEEFELLRGREHFGSYSVQIWEIMCKAAMDVGAYEQAFEMTALLADSFSVQPVHTDYYLLLRKKAELMQELGDRFENAQMEEEITRVCDLAFALSPGNPKVAEKMNMRLWAEYYFYGRPDMRGETGSRKIEECIRRYRACCTEEEARWDVGICVLEVMRERVKGAFILDVVNEWALKGLRILDKLYGEQAVEQSDMDFLFQPILTAVAMTEEDGELYRRLFTQYYKSFYMGGNWKVYSKLASACWGRKLNPQDDYREDERKKVELSDIVEQGIFYLSNLSQSNVRNQLKLLLSYHLRSELMRTIVDMSEDESIGIQQLIRNKVLNNRVLLFFLHKSLEALCLEKGVPEMQRLGVLLRAVFVDSNFADACFDTKEKRQLLGLLALCGLETDQASWMAEYADSTEGEEFHILKAIRGWQWEVDLQADVQMTAALLYVAWRLKNPVQERIPEQAVLFEVTETPDRKPSVEERILELLGKRLRDANEKVHFWFELMREVRSVGGAWERHMEELFRQEMEKLKKNSGISSGTRQRLAAYNPELANDQDVRKVVSKGRQDTSEGEIYEEELKSRLEAGDYDTLRHRIKEVLEGFKPNVSDDRLAIAYFYLSAARDRGMDRFIEGIQNMKQLPVLGGEYFVLRAYAYLDDKSAFAACYREHCTEIWKRLQDGFCLVFYPDNELCHMAEYVFSLGEDGIAEDYCGRLADLYAKSHFKYEYTKRILGRLEWLTEHVSFETVWRKERCLKEIDLSNYDIIYDFIEQYLSTEELMDIFITEVWSRDRFQTPGRPQKAKICFFESEYFLWLQEKFGEAGEDRLKAEFPELYDAREEYQKNYRDHYLWQVNKEVNELRAMVDSVY